MGEDAVLGGVDHDSSSRCPWWYLTISSGSPAARGWDAARDIPRQQATLRASVLARRMSYVEMSEMDMEVPQ